MSKILDPFIAQCRVIHDMYNNPSADDCDHDGVADVAFYIDGEQAVLSALEENGNELAKRYQNDKVHFVKFPAANSHLVQPLDVSVGFREMKKNIKNNQNVIYNENYDRILTDLHTKYVGRHGNQSNNRRWLAFKNCVFLLADRKKNIYNNSMKASNIINAFKSSGVYPPNFNKTAARYSCFQQANDFDLVGTCNRMIKKYLISDIEAYGLVPEEILNNCAEELGFSYPIEDIPRDQLRENRGRACVLNSDAHFKWKNRAITIHKEHKKRQTIKKEGVKRVKRSRASKWRQKTNALNNQIRSQKATLKSTIMELERTKRFVEEIKPHMADIVTRMRHSDSWTPVRAISERYTSFRRGMRNRERAKEKKRKKTRKRLTLGDNG